MYPIHKYLPTSFGTYLMHIENGPKRVTVSSVPTDVTQFKSLVRAKQAKDYNRTSQNNTGRKVGQGDNKKAPARGAIDLQPSYNMRYLQHTGQTITEPPSDIVIVDKITPAAWMQNRPKPWKDIVKIHETENPLLTSTVIRPPRSPKTKHPDYPAGKKLLRRGQYVPQAIPYEPSYPKEVLKPAGHIKTAMLPHLTKQIPSINKERHQLREAAARKRRRRADKIMNLVSKRAQHSTLNSWDIAVDDVTTKAGTKTATYLKGELPVPIKSEQKLYTHSDKMKVPSNTTIHTEPESYPKLRNIDPREDQVIINKQVLERLGDTMPYIWAGGSSQ
uniref:uncharacterized protein LOC104265515 n=1 Tax=Ciona intestinalis TaxID=7719 RepID=UPI000EF4DD50|nr:uncharacterized protein LOC104265515 [Ciona intestinalis]|eukprot:XP_018673418.2 uncharacterized protein LOC104265515 [Ciona intestinalis]